MKKKKRIVTEKKKLQHLRVNPILCDGFGYCAEIVPELIQLDDWGFPIVSKESIEDEQVLRHAARAVSICPKVALFFVEKPSSPT